MSYPSWTSCCQSSSWYQFTIPMAAFLALFGGASVGVIIGLVATAVLPGVAAGLAAAFLVGVYYCTWWLTIRLICLSPTSPGDRGVLGVIYNTEPPQPTLGFWNLGAYDNDYSFNLLVYSAVPGDMLPNWYANKFSPPQTWDPSATPTLQTGWAGQFPTFPFDDINLILPQQQAMGSLGLGFTGQYVEYTGNLGDPSQLPLMSITVLPATVTRHSGETVQFTATGYRADGTAEDLTSGPDAVTWSSSGPSASIDSGGFATADDIQVGTVEITATDPTGAVSGAAHMTTKAQNPPYNQGPRQQFLIHCEIEGAGMENFRTLLIALAAACAVAAVASFFPPIGTVIAAILLFLVFLALLFGGPAIQGNGGGNPPGGTSPTSPGYPYSDAPSPDSMVNIVYVYGRWVFDSLHQPAGSNELHPVHFVNQVAQVPQSDITSGNWPSTIADTKAKYDDAYIAINQPGTVAAQSLPQNQWVLHPLLDGCLAGSGYAVPPPPPAPK